MNSKNILIVLMLFISVVLSATSCVSPYHNGYASNGYYGRPARYYAPQRTVVVVQPPRYNNYPRHHHGRGRRW